MIEVFKKVPVHHRDIILADSAAKPGKLFKELDATKDYGAVAKVTNQPKYELFTDEILKRLKSTVKTVLVLFCRDGVAFLK